MTLRPAAKQALALGVLSGSPERDEKRQRNKADEHGEMGRRGKHPKALKIKMKRA